MRPRIFIILLCLVLSSCEGYKSLVLENRSAQEATLVFYPSKQVVWSRNSLSQLTDAPTYIDSVLLTLPVDSTLLVRSRFTTFVNGRGITAADLPMDSMRIHLGNRTIKANSTAEIIGLIQREELKANKSKKQKRNSINTIILE